jgi:hypothetical protein
MIKKLKKVFFQPHGDLCVSTAIKNVIDSQFEPQSISLNKINSLCRYNGKYGSGIALDLLKEYLEPPLKKLKIQYNEGENLNIDFLADLLSKGIYPIICFHIKDYNQWKKNTHIVVEADSEVNYHVLIVVGVDKPNEKIFLFDTLRDKYKKYENDNDTYDELSFTIFYRYWAKEGLFYPAIWFTPIIDKKQKKLNV